MFPLHGEFQVCRCIVKKIGVALVLKRRESLEGVGGFGTDEFIPQFMDGTVAEAGAPELYGIIYHFVNAVFGAQQQRSVFQALLYVSATAAQICSYAGHDAIIPGIIMVCPVVIGIECFGLQVYGDFWNQPSGAHGNANLLIR
ncbi:MAG: hypothetical protein IPL65_06070 [Lewinellaceae bacterium]|nr:hypothetical protein [Lewinellaceae bacterium]